MRKRKPERTRSGWDVKDVEKMWGASVAPLVADWKLDDYCENFRGEKFLRDMDYL